MLCYTKETKTILHLSNLERERTMADGSLGTYSLEHTHAWSEGTLCRCGLNLVLDVLNPRDFVKPRSSIFPHHLNLELSEGMGSDFSTLTYTLLHVFNILLTNTHPSGTPQMPSCL